MTVLICCVSNEKQTTPISEDVYIPAFPEIKDGVVIPLDADFHIVVPTEENDDSEVTFVLIPFWYWKLIVEYKVQSQRAMKTLSNND